MVSALIVNKTRQSPARNRIPAVPLRAFTSPMPVAANAEFEIDLCAHGNGKLAPLTDRRGRKYDLFHRLKIA
jgi:hypothetical protein